jgi:pilus assembly protein CpaF
MNSTPGTVPSPSRINGARDPAEYAFQRLKVDLHRKLISSLDLTTIGKVDRRELNDAVRSAAHSLCEFGAAALSENDQQRLMDELIEEVFGHGPLERLMADPTVSDILVNGPHEVYVERNGRLARTDIIFADDDHLIRVIQRIVGRIGRRIDQVSPMVDARLPDGSRVNAVIPPLAIDGPTLSVRRFGTHPLQSGDLLENGSIRDEMVRFLAAATEARVSFLVSGGAGAGKTTLLNAMSAFIPHDERLITIEDSAELRLRHPHVIRLESRQSNTEGTGEVTQRELVRNSLRMRPDRILVGEVRGGEALDMLQAMNTGHEGSLTTIHANDARDALDRLEMMVAMTGLEIPVHVVRQYIAAGIKLVVHLARLRGGVRRVTRISEIVGVENGQFRLEEVFGYEQLGVNRDGVAFGEFYATGYQPVCLKRIRAAGVDLSDDCFAARRFGADG